MLNPVLPDTDSLLVGYSGGRDSLAVTDLCCKSGKRVVLFFMEFLPGMDYTAYWCGLAESRWKVEVRRYQHWGVSIAFRTGTFLPFPINVPRIKLADIERAVRADTGIEWIAYGYKSIDSLQRRAWMNKWSRGLNPDKKILAPLKDWNGTDVQAYLQRRRIPAPDQGKRVSGIDLTPGCMEFFRREWPADYQRILRAFPLAGRQADRAAEIPVRRKAGRPAGSGNRGKVDSGVLELQ